MSHCVLSLSNMTLSCMCRKPPTKSQYAWFDEFIVGHISDFQAQGVFYFKNLSASSKHIYG